MTMPSAQQRHVAVVGSGPSGFYAAAHLFKLHDIPVSVDMFDRLPTPFGLVRSGVAPDHPKIKSVTRVFDRTAGDPRFRFFGNVEVGRDVAVTELTEAYDAVIYAYGANRGKRAGIPGDRLDGNYSATEVVGWYNGHPDHRGKQVNLTGPRAVVIGTGNVALDVARILAMPPSRLASTDIADHALEALRQSGIEEVVVLGRRGPEHAACTAPELEELGAMDGVDIVVDPRHLPEAHPEDSHGKLNLLADFAVRPARPGNRRIVLMFHTRPLEVRGNDAVTGIRVESRGATADFPANTVIHAVGYTGSPMAGLPFDTERGIVCNNAGRVVDLPGSYVTGWIKRGPTGVIGTNKACALETVEALADDARAGVLPATSSSARQALQARLSADGCTDYAGWTAIDEYETGLGRDTLRPRVKVTDLGCLVDIARSRRAAG